jgi:hypothetical protein
MLFRCVDCGGSVEPVAKPGRTGFYKFVELPIPEDLEILTCAGCGEEYFNNILGKAYDEAMEQVYQTRGK